MGIVERRRHQAVGFVAGVAEHDALVARAFVLVVLGVHALGDVRRLLVQQHFDLGALPVEALLLVADVADGEARRVDDDLLGDLFGPAGLARDHDAVGRGERLAGDAQVLGRPAVLRAQAEERVDDLIGDAVADLVGMAFGNRLRW